MAKQGLFDQHFVLHQQWPGDCCLCGKEAQVRELQKSIAELREALTFAIHEYHSAVKDSPSDILDCLANEEKHEMAK